MNALEPSKKTNNRSTKLQSNQFLLKIPSSPILAMNSTFLFFTLHSPLAPANTLSSSPDGGNNTSSSIYFPYAVHVCPAHSSLPKCTPEK